MAEGWIRVILSSPAFWHGLEATSPLVEGASCRGFPGRIIKT